MQTTAGEDHMGVLLMFDVGLIACRQCKHAFYIFVGQERFGNMTRVSGLANCISQLVPNPLISSLIVY